jgi:two-component system LytT family sensor kinase
MKVSKRFIFQSFSWLGLWIILWAQASFRMPFFYENISILICQILIIGMAIYVLIPKFLLLKKYVLFAISSLLLLFLLSFTSSSVLNSTRTTNNKVHSEIRELPPRDSNQLLRRPPPVRNGNRSINDRPRPIENRPPPIPKIFTHFLFLTLTFILAILIEVLLFAKQKEAETIRSKNENLQTELKLLKSQINPHFLFNALNNIYALSGIDANKTQQSISFLSNMLRYVLYECERPFVTLQKEIDYIENYIQLFSLKSSKKFPIQTEFNLSKPHDLIAPMLLIPFVENAFKHSNIERTQDAFISIKIKTVDNSILLKIANNIPKNQIIKDDVGGIGLENVRKRLDILYPKRHNLVINRENGIFKVELKLELNV